MRTHYARVLSSQRIVPVAVDGPIFYVLRPRQSGPNPSVAGPYRRNDRRFYLFPREWEPAPRPLPLP